MNQTWTLRGRSFSAPATQNAAGALCPQEAPWAIWGIVNVTPDSFYDGGRWVDPGKALSRAQKLLEEGAAILDLGGASSRPGAADVPAEEEWQRLEPVLSRLMAHPHPPLVSIDTWRAEVAAKAICAGVEIINDVSGYAWDEGMLEVLAEYKPGYVLMHSPARPENMQANPRYRNVLDEVKAWFEQKMEALVQAGLPESNIILDPGIGFGKNLEHNLSLLARLDYFDDLGRPLLLGISNKSLFGELFGLDKSQRNGISAVCTALAAQQGVLHHRVHDVAGTRMALELVRAMKR